MKKIWLVVLFFANVGYSNEFEKNTGTVVNDPKFLWGSTPQDSLILPMMNQYVVNEVIKIYPIKGHHFNLKAFNSCQGKKPIKTSELEIHCQFEEAGKYKVSTYICDDANTFCKFQFFHVVVTAPRGYKSALKKHVSSNILYIPKTEFKLPDIFIKNKADYAIQKSKKENKPLLLIFSAQWCPACNMLNENVFLSSEFQSSIRDVVPLILDVDSDISWELKEKFKVGGYPTVIFTTPQLHEVYRFVGYKTLGAVQRWLDLAKKHKDEPIEFVLSKVNQLRAVKDDSKFQAEYQEKVMRLARWHLDRDENKEAKIYFNQISNSEAKMMMQLMDLKTLEGEALEKTLRQLIKTYSNDVRLASWLFQLAELRGAEVKDFVLEYSSRALLWTDHKQLEESEYTRADIFYLLAETEFLIGRGDESKVFYKKCADEYARIEKLSLSKNPRGAPMEQAFCLAKAGDADQALGIFKKLSQVYKNEFAFNYYYARTLQQSLKNKEALVFAVRAYENAYGDNLVRAATLKAQLELDLKDIKSAEKTATQTLEKIYLPQNLTIRTHKYVQNLREILQRIQYVNTGKTEGL